MSSRQRLTQAALDLFLDQGITSTTTRQIADRAGVNEVTLFRNFGNKYGLLLAMLQPAADDTGLPNHLPLAPAADLRTYASDCLHLLEQVATFLRSLIGEAEQYPPEHRAALQVRLTALQQEMADHLQHVVDSHVMRLPPLDLARFLGTLLLGHTLIEATTGDALWANREDFLDALMRLLTDAGDDAAIAPQTPRPIPRVAVATRTLPPAGADPGGKGASAIAEALIDLPATWVHQLLRQSKNLGGQDLALAYVLFGAGLRPAEIVRLERVHQICDKSQHVLQVMGPGQPRQVPLNQWILGKRYGSYTSNPLTKWLKSRKDEASAMFIDAAGAPLTLKRLHQHWEQWWQGMPIGTCPPQPEHARQTWCVEMLMRGMSLENLSILAGCDVPDLEVYAQRAREKAAIAAATQLDRKPPPSTN